MGSRGSSSGRGGAAGGSAAGARSQAQRSQNKASAQNTQARQTRNNQKNNKPKRRSIASRIGSALGALDRAAARTMDAAQSTMNDIQRLG